MRTPWGDSETLRDRRLPPGRGTASREEARRNQRERLFAAMVASCERRGYEATSIAHLLELSGISRQTFYEEFEDKISCFTAVVHELVDGAIAIATQRLAEAGSAEERVRRAFEAFIELLVEQPAAARLCLVESYAAGEAGVGPVRDAVDRVGLLARDALAQMPGHEDIPLDVVRAINGAIYLIVHRRLKDSREAELPGLVPALWDWGMSYPPPPQPLRLKSRRDALELVGATPPFAAYDAEQRLIRAFAAVVAEKGYGAATIADIVAAASMSQSTFYVHFDDKLDAMRAAIDSSGAQLLAATMPRARRAPDWPSAVRVAMEASCGFLASEPAFARLRMVDVYAAGSEAIAGRDGLGAELLRTLMGPDFEDAPEVVHELTLEAIVGAIYGVLYDQIRGFGPSSLPEVAPLLTYVALAPFIGAEAACEVANAGRPAVTRPAPRVARRPGGATQKPPARAGRAGRRRER